MNSPTLKDADNLLHAGLAASAANDSEKAMDLFAQASSVCPSSPVPHFLIGSEYAGLGQYDKAEAALANAVVLAPGYGIARYQLGLLQFSSGRAAVALITWEPLFALDDAQALGHFVRGFAALAEDAFAQAKAHFQAGLARDTSNAALSADIEKVIQRIEEAQALNANATASESPAGTSEAAAHVLLANYGKFSGTLH